MKDLQDMARKSLNGELNRIYTTNINRNYIGMESYHKRKRGLSSKYDKLINISLQPIPDKIEATYKKNKY